jgi:hypothetical protein
MRYFSVRKISRLSWNSNKTIASELGLKWRSRVKILLLLKKKAQRFENYEGVV